MKSRLSSLRVLVCVFLSLSSSLVAQERRLDIDITSTSIEDLLQVEVSSVLLRPQPNFQAPAASYVLTAEDIRRSGALTIPDALRLVPGVSVQQIDSNKYAVSIRGFTDRLASKLLVLVDGRSVYNQLYSGVFWEAQDTLLEDIDRIEVIRGPGGTLWGANAVNGVINIITKSAAETQGALVYGGAGNEARGFGYARYGYELKEDHHVRAYAEYLNRDEGYLADRDEHDNYDMFRTGFRSDQTLRADRALTISGDYYNGTAEEPATLEEGRDVGLSGANILGRLSIPRDSGQTELQTYFDYYHYGNESLTEDRYTFDTILAHRWNVSSRHDLYANINYRLLADEIIDGPVLGVDPQHRTDHRIAVSLQDEIALSEQLLLVLGTKLGYNTYSDFEIQPNARLSWLLSDEDVLWAGISRAVRTPSRLEDDIQAPNVVGSRDFQSENLIAYELGYRIVPLPTLTFDIATFIFEYDDLVTVEDGAVRNGMNADSYGGEIAMNWIPTDWFRLIAGYSYVELDASLDQGSTDFGRLELIEGIDPESQATLRSQFTLNDRWKIDGALRYVDRLQSRDVSDYIVADLRVAYQIDPSLELSLVARDLFEDHHFEYSGLQATEVEQSIYAAFRWRY